MFGDRSLVTWVLRGSEAQSTANFCLDFFIESDNLLTNLLSGTDFL
ncbi:MAG: hypothetical protein F6K24_29135 [Okeania sp. SIO2D1]|nr:hypothetical protein [Okeania sp. SIO2D1]